MNPQKPTEKHTFSLFFQRLLWLTIRIETILTTLILTALILLACYQIALRWTTSGGIAWIDPLLRYLTLWGGLLGAALATAEGNHIALDIVGFIAGKRLKRWINLANHCFSTLVSGLLVWAALIFIQNEFAYGGSGLFAVTTGVWNLIFPIAFSLICLHFALSTIQTIRKLSAKESSTSTSEPV